MSRFIFINLSTKNVAAAREFYEKLGFEINKDYSTDENVFVVVSDSVQLILVSEAFLRQHGETRAIADASKVTEGSVAISVDSNEEVDKLVDAALAAGGTSAGAIEEAGIGLYARAFYDLDGHKIDINHMSM
jgi:predicted lactoylglutathione lyase